MSKELPFFLPRTRLVFPHQPFRDDFLLVMGKVFQWSRLFGVAGPDRRFWRLWGVLVLVMLVMIQIGAIYKLVKLLAGLTLYSSGNRSITARIAGTMFYTCTFTSLLLTWRLYSSWDKISAVWVTFERKLMVMVPTDVNLKRRMVIMIIFMAACSALEHIMSVMSAVEFDCPPELLLEKYVLASHGFIFIQSDYSVWVGILVFIVSNIATILWNFQDMLIVLVSMGLTSRYLRLNQCIAKISTMDNRDTKWSQDTETLKMYMWRQIRDAYVKQAMLVRRVDESIGGLILLSSFQNFYFICLQLFLGITQGITGAVINRMYYLVSMVWLCVRFSCVVLSAANVNVHSRKALRYLHSYSTRGYNTEVDRLQKQLSRDFVALSGMGFFYLDRTILLQMAGAVITYELVLIQFDGRG